MVGSSKMKAAFVSRPGGWSALRVGELPVPEIKEDQILVRVRASVINPADIGAGSGGRSMDRAFPHVPGSDFAGIVERVGAKVHAFSRGDRVWGSNQGIYGRQGTFAEFAAIDERWVYPIPAGQSDVGAAAGAMPGITAHLGLFKLAELKAGEVVFVHGGGGGVGAAVIQLAKWAGATVISTAADREQANRCKGWGADLVVCEHEADWFDKVWRYARDRCGVNVWFETRAEPDLEAVVSFMADEGRIVLMAGGGARVLLPIGPFHFKRLRLLGLQMMSASAEDQAAAAYAINRCFLEGKWDVAIGRVFPLSEVASPPGLQEANAVGSGEAFIGKCVVRLDESAAMK